ncbi:MAG: GNAT family N-acetyltransferase [Crocinitomicaceae bacterium]|nr:GNAT family N-acetyltransferase [Crocinitomicaceae bacterium]|tara:strand:+ start:1909 stop:2370 length:462 start_codon:yes stop_codon:yes gene_type:complete
MINFIPFTDKYSAKFYDLNVVWLNELFLLEPYDEYVLKNPKVAIIDKGGYVFFIEYKNEIVGTFALMPCDDRSYELMKMTVKKSHRKKGIGNEIMCFVINFCKKKQARSICLYSNTKLKNAIKLYEDHSFTEIPLPDSSPYYRADIKMIHYLS